MTLKRAAILLAFVCLGCVMAAAQEQKRCTLKLAEVKAAQELYGLRPGMTVEQVKALVPSLEAGRVDELGFATTSFSPQFNPQMDKAAFAGARTISLEFLDGKLFKIWIGFNSSFKWKTLEEFVPGMSAALGLPVDSWSGDSLKPALECEEFELAAQMIGGAPSLRLTERAARELWEQRRAEQAEKRSAREADEP